MSPTEMTPDDFISANPQFDPCTLELEKQLIFGEANVDELVNKYTEHFHREAVVRLLQDINKQASFYANLLEAFKQPSSDFHQLVGHYVKIGAIPEKAIPPDTSVGAAALDWMRGMVDRVTEKLEKLARAGLQVLARYGEELAAWLRPRANAALAVQATVSWKPEVTVQLQFAASWAPQA